MNAIVIEHVPVAELPEAWRAKLARSADTHVTVRIEQEGNATAPGEVLAGAKLCFDAPSPTGS